MTCPAPAARATPLSAEARRSSLVSCTLDLVLEHGPGVSTRQIARAAGVAEGTIFRVFATKDELIRAAVRKAFDPSPLLAQLTKVDEPDLTATALRIVECLQAGLARVFHLMGALGHVPDRGSPSEQAERDDAIYFAIEVALTPFAASLRCSPRDAARSLWWITFAASHPRTTHGSPLAPAAVVDLALHGIARAEDGPAC